MKRSLKGKRALLTGGAGFFGANLIRRLLKEDCSVHVTVRKTSSLWRIRDFQNDIRLHTVDLLDLPALSAVTRAVQPDLICHAAVQRSGDPDAIIRNNVEMTSHLLDILSRIDYENCLCFGSSMEFGKNRTAVTEQFPFNPESPYAKGKAQASLACREYVRSSGKPLSILRPFSVYGSWEAPERLIPTTIRACLLRKEMALTPPGYSRDFTFIEDLVDACMLALSSQERGLECNIASGRGKTNEEVVELIQEIMNVRIPIRQNAYPPRETDTDVWVGNADLAKRSLGWEPRTGLREGLENTIEWFRTHLSKYPEEWPA